MTEIISNLFGRPKYDTATDETVATEAIETQPTESAPADHESDVKDDVEGEETDESAADEDVASEASEETSGEDDEDEQDDETVAAEADEAAAEDVAETEESDETEESAEPTAAEADEADKTEEDEESEESEPVAEAAPAIEAVPVVAAVPVAAAEPITAAEPVVEPTRPAAGARGNVTVDHGVVAKVVTIVAGKIDGVHSLDADGISVEVDGDVATIKVSLVIEFGHAVKALAEQVRVDVIEAVEQFLNFDVAAVDVHVSDIHLPTV